MERVLVHEVGVLTLNGQATTIANTSAIAASVAGGSTDIGFSAILSIATAFKKGVPFTIVAPGNVYDSAAPIAAIVVDKNSPIKTAKDLNGKTIQFNFGGSGGLHPAPTHRVIKR